jgi:WD40 repeat protein
VKVWDAGTGALLQTLLGHKQAVVHLAFSPDAQGRASGGDDTTVRLWRAADGGLARTLTGSDHVYTLGFSGDSRWLASGGREKGALGTLWKQVAPARLRGARKPTIRLWRVSDGAQMQALSEHADDVWSVAISPDSRWLASASADHTVKLWRLVAE